MNPQLQQIQSALELAIKFNEAYPDLPPGYFDLGGPQFGTWCYSHDRNETLEAYAKCFGSDGWTAVFQSKRVDWEKTILGIKVVLYDTKETPPLPPPRPVLPSEWPLQLTDSVSVCH